MSTWDAQLKPVCMDLMRFKPWIARKDSDGRFTRLLNVISTLLDTRNNGHVTRADRVSLLADMADFVLFPVVQVLGDPDAAQSNTTSAFQCLRAVLEGTMDDVEGDRVGADTSTSTSSSVVTRGTHAANILALAATYISFGKMPARGEKVPRGGEARVPDELRMAAVQSALALVGGTELPDDPYLPPSLPPLSTRARTVARMVTPPSPSTQQPPPPSLLPHLLHLISSLLESLLLTRDVAYRLTALSALDHILSLYRTRRDIVEGFLPQLASTILKVVMGTGGDVKHATEAVGAERTLNTMDPGTSHAGTHHAVVGKAVGVLCNALEVLYGGPGGGGPVGGDSKGEKVEVEVEAVPPTPASWSATLAEWKRLASHPPRADITVDSPTPHPPTPLAVLLSTLLPHLSTSPHPSVRSRAVHLAVSTLSTNLPTCSVPAVDTLVRGSADTVARVAECAQPLAAVAMSRMPRDLRDRLRTDMHARLANLPRELSSRQSDAWKCDRVDWLISYARAAPDLVEPSRDGLDGFVHALVRSLSAPVQGDGVRDPNAPFGVFHSAQPLKKVAVLLRAMARLGDVGGGMVDLFVGMFNLPGHEDAAAWCLAQVVVGVGGWNDTADGEGWNVVQAAQSTRGPARKSARKRWKSIPSHLAASLTAVLDELVSALDADEAGGPGGSLHAHAPGGVAAVTPPPSPTPECGQSSTSTATYGSDPTVDVRLHPRWAFHLVSHLVLVLGPARVGPRLAEAVYAGLAYPSSLTSDTLAVLAAVCDHSDPASLVRANVDLVVDVASARLRRCGGSVGNVVPKPAVVLEGMVRCAGKEVVPYVEEGLDGVLDMVDWCAGKEGVVGGLVGVVAGIVEVVVGGGEVEVGGDGASVEKEREPEVVVPKKASAGPLGWLEGCSKEMRELFVANAPSSSFLATKSTDDGEPTPIQEISSYFLSRAQDAKRAAEERTDVHAESTRKDEEEPQPDTEDPPEPSRRGRPPLDPDEPPPPTPEQSFVLRILNKALHLLSHTSPHVRAATLRLVRSAIPALSTRDRELWPLVHKLWPSVVSRLDDRERHVAIEADLVVSGMARASGDFISRRVATDVWPRYARLLAGLRNPASQDGVRPVDPTYKFSTHGRLLRGALGTLAVLVNAVPMRYPDVRAVEEAVGWFVDRSRWSAEVVEDAERVWKGLVEVDPDGSWLTAWGMVGGVAWKGSVGGAVAGNESGGEGEGEGRPVVPHLPVWFVDARVSRTGGAVGVEGYRESALRILEWVRERDTRGAGKLKAVGY